MWIWGKKLTLLGKTKKISLKKNPSPLKMGRMLTGRARRKIYI